MASKQVLYSHTVPAPTQCGFKGCRRETIKVYYVPVGVVMIAAPLCMDHAFRALEEAFVMNTKNEKLPIKWLDTKKEPPASGQVVDVLAKSYTPATDTFEYKRITNVTFNGHYKNHHSRWDGVDINYRVVGWLPLPHIGGMDES